MCYCLRPERSYGVLEIYAWKVERQVKRQNVYSQTTDWLKRGSTFEFLGKCKLKRQERKVDNYENDKNKTKYSQLCQYWEGQEPLGWGPKHWYYQFLREDWHVLGKLNVRVL